MAEFVVKDPDAERRRLLENFENPKWGGPKWHGNPSDYSAEERYLKVYAGHPENFKTHARAETIAAFGRNRDRVLAQIARLKAARKALRVEVDALRETAQSFQATAPITDRDFARLPYFFFTDVGDDPANVNSWPGNSMEDALADTVRRIMGPDYTVESALAEAQAREAGQPVATVAETVDLTPQRMARAENWNR